MNRNLAIAIALGCAACGSAFADDITVDPIPFVSTTSRLQVQEELRQFLSAAVNPWADHYDPLAHFRGAMTRAQVTADFLATRDSVAAFTAEDSGSSYLARSKDAGASGVVEVAQVE